jgi:hypothetical protein
MGYLYICFNTRFYQKRFVILQVFLKTVGVHKLKLYWLKGF